LNEFIFSLFSLKKNAKVLDLCCGRGSQTLKFAKLCPKGTVHAWDISQESLDFIDSQKLKNVKTARVDLDAVSRMSFQENYFDLIHCAYGLYYAKDARAVIKKLYAWLKPGGSLIITGPVSGTNQELFSLMEKVYPIDPEILFSVRSFMPKIVFPTMKALFRSVQKRNFENKVTCPTPADLLPWLRSSTHYRARYDRELRVLLEKHYAKHGRFVITKKAMSVIGVK